MLQPLDLAQQPPVVREKGRASLEVALDQRRAQENPVREGRVDLAVVHAPVGVHRQAVERAALHRDHLGARLFPMRPLLVALEHVRAHLLEPLRVDRRHRAREKAGGLDQLGGDDPLAGLLRPRAGMHPELDAARAAVASLLLVLHPDVAEQPGEQRAMDRGVALLLRRVGARAAPSQLLDRVRQLLVDVAPLAHPRKGQEVVAAGLPEILAGQRPELQVREEIGALDGEARVTLVRGARLLERAFARVAHRERGGDDEHLLEAAFVPRRDQHPADPRVEREPGELAADVGQGIGVVHGAQFREQRVAVGDRARKRRIEEREFLHLAEVEAQRAQDHGGERGAQQLGIGERRPAVVIVLAVQAEADAVRNAAAAPGALPGRRLGNVLHLKLFHLVAVAVALDPRQARVHHVADARHRERGLRDVGRQHDPARRARPEHAVLLGVGQAAVERQDLGVAQPALADRRRRVPDLALAGQEHQHVAGSGAAGLLHRVGERILLLVARGVLGIAPDLPVADLHRIEAPRDFDHGRAAEVPGKFLRVDGGRGDDELELRAPRQQLLQVPEQEIDVEAALVRFVEDDRVVGPELGVALRLGEQDAVGHEFHEGAPAHPVVKADFVADDSAELGLELLGDARRDRACRDAPRLRVADDAGGAAPHLEQDLRDLRGLARPGFAADDHDRMRLNRPADLLAPLVDRQRGVEADPPHHPPASIRST